MRNILVTGGGGGIGAALAEGFAALGDRVILLDRNLNAAEQVADVLRAKGATVHCIECDLTDEGQVRSLVTALADDGLEIDVLLNNAGIEARATPGTETYLADWRRVMSVNLDSLANLAQALLPQLSAKAGCIVNTASIQSWATLHTANTVYSVSKGAVAQLTRALAVEFAPHGVRVNAIAPGVVETPLIRQEGMDSSRFRLFLDRIPMKRFAQPQEMAGPAIFLASGAAAYVTGVVLPVDGGFLAM